MTREIPGVQNPVSSYAARRGWLVFRMKFLGRVGCPDSWFFKDGRLIIIEFKAPGKPPNPIQARIIARFAAHGFKVHVIDNADEGRALFD